MRHEDIGRLGGNGGADNGFPHAIQPDVAHLLVDGDMLVNLSQAGMTMPLQIVTRPAQEPG
jgi:hypothetical protein